MVSGGSSLVAVCAGSSLVAVCAGSSLVVVCAGPLWLRCVRVLSGCGERGLLSGCGVWPCPCSGFSGCGARALGTRGLQELWHKGLAAPRHVGSSQIRDQTRVSYIGRLIFFFFKPLSHQGRP